MDVCFNWTADNDVDVDRVLTRYYLPACYAIIFAVGLLGNVASLSIYLTKLRPLKSGGVIMVNLAASDLLYVLSLPFLVHYYGNGGRSWALGDFTCRLVRFGFHLNLYGSVLLLTCLALFRYAAVVRPLAAAARLRGRRWGVAACAAVWLAAAAETAPMLGVLSVTERRNETLCLDLASRIWQTQSEWYAWLLTVLGFLLPLVAVFTCYIGVARALAQGPDTSSLRRKRARRVTVLILAVFVACFLPYHVLRLLRIETLRAAAAAAATGSCATARLVNAAYVVSRPLAGLNTFSNLALYTLSGDRFRRAFVAAFHPRCLVSKARALLRPATVAEAVRDEAGPNDT